MYRSIDTEVWDDTWFADLDPDGKLLFLYLLTNRRTTACGAFEISVRMIVNETGIGAERVTELIRSFAPRVLWFDTANLIWVRNFYRRQFRNANEKQIAAVRSSLAAFPPMVEAAFREEYPGLFPDDDTPEIAHPEPMDSLSIGVPLARAQTVAVAVAGTATESATGTATVQEERASAPPPASIADTVETLLLAPWINDEPVAVEKAVCRSFRLVPDFNSRDGPLEAEKFVRRNAAKPPSDWYRTWLNWIKNATKYERERQTSSNGRPATTQAGRDAVDMVGEIVRRHAG